MFTNINVRNGLLSYFLIIWHFNIRITFFVFTTVVRKFHRSFHTPTRTLLQENMFHVMPSKTANFVQAKNKFLQNPGYSFYGNGFNL